MSDITVIVVMFRLRKNFWTTLKIGDPLNSHHPRKRQKFFIQVNLRTYKTLVSTSPTQFSKLFSHIKYENAFLLALWPCFHNLKKSNFFLDFRIRSCHSVVFCGKAVLKTFGKFARKCLARISFFIKLQDGNIKFFRTIFE